MGAIVTDATLTQKDMILSYMKEHGSISQLDAALELGCWRLSARIWDLRHDGYEIDQELVKTKNRMGKAVTYAKYRLRDGV